ncbi:MAG: VWA domain-containing protein [Holophagales bacterium]|nr:VWA domain-containing protein [Holophagales bacterium]MYF97311.1 VWA domain-containing protein [Holophagales bacterium]
MSPSTDSSRSFLPARRQTALGTALLAIAVWTAPEEAVHAQAGSAQGTVGFGTDAVALAGLEGTWVRDTELSEDPVHRMATDSREAASLPPPLAYYAEELSLRRRGLRIETRGHRVFMQNAAGERIHLPLDGVARSFTPGRKSAAYAGGGVLELATTGANSTWLWLETFYRSGHQLVHVSESRNFGFPDLSLRTVYDHADGRPPPADPVNPERLQPSKPAAIRIVPPRRTYREFLYGPVEVQTLVVDPLITMVEFLHDGRPVKQARKPPFKARLRLSDPPREETVEVRAYRDDGAQVGADRIVLNRLDSAFAVRIASLRPVVAGGSSAASVTVRITVPRTAVLARVEIYRGERRVAAFDDRDWRTERQGADTVRVEALVEDVEPDDFVRVVARLADGRQQEDAELLQRAEYSSEIDVQLVQLQILAVDRDGEPVSDLRPGDFEIRENSERRPAENLHVSNDVPLVLGITIDSSVSMGLVWQRLHTVVRRFMAGALDAGDRAFLVDFDDTIRLLQPLTGNKPLLAARLNRLLVDGGTALNDGLLFSLLQFRSEPGRRALVVVTDGNDGDSRFTAAQVRDFAESMGVPIYFIGVGWNAPPPILARKLTRRTGGQLFRIHPDLPPSELAAEMERVFDRIDTDLRHQYVLTYYSKVARGEAVEPEVRSLRRDVRVKSVSPLQGLE